MPCCDNRGLTASKVTSPYQKTFKILLTRICLNYASVLLWNTINVTWTVRLNASLRCYTAPKTHLWHLHISSTAWNAMIKKLEYVWMAWLEWLSIISSSVTSLIVAVVSFILTALSTPSSYYPANDFQRTKEHTTPCIQKLLPYGVLENCEEVYFVTDIPFFADRIVLLSYMDFVSLLRFGI